MAINYKTPSQVADEYLLFLKSLRPEINDRQVDSDWYVRARVTGGVLSGVYSDQRKVGEDAFPQSARHDALDRHLYTYFNGTFNPATVANGFALVTGATGTAVSGGTLSFTYLPNGNAYVNTEDFTITASSGELVAIQSVNTGQIQNLLEGASLSVSTPPLGIDGTAIVANGPLSDGRNQETDAEAAARILAFIRNPVRGGTASDYEFWARTASPAVVTASVLRFPRGLGTVGVVISAGTTDIDQAIDNGDPIVLIPSDELVQTVQDYIETQRPLTDCVTVYKPIQVFQDVTVNVRFSSGSSGTILTGQTLTQAELVQREVSRALYKTPPGGRRLGASGYVVASEIEEVIDLGLSASPYTVGILPILLDRQVLDLSASGANRGLLNNEIVYPGTITINELVG